MIRTLLRSLLLGLALLCFFAAAFALGLDGLRLSSGAAAGLTPLGEFWGQLDPESLEGARLVISPPIWDRIGVWLLLQPAVAVLCAVGFFLLILRPMPERRRSLFS
jgi:hypothetical protein